MNWLRTLLGVRGGMASTRAALVTAKPRVESLEDRCVPTVQYYGGNVLTHVEAQALFLGKDWSTISTDAAQTKTLNSFLTDVTGGAYVDAFTNAGYGVGRGTATTGVTDKTAYTSGSIISDAAIHRRIQADISSGLLSAPDSNRLYVVYVDPNVAVNLGAGQGTTRQGILGYHGAFGGVDANGNPVVIRYAVVVSPGGPARNSSMGTAVIDQLTAVSSHEIAEAITDPDVNYGNLGWYDPRRGEIGDVTENNPNALVRMDGYLVQEVAGKNDQLLPIQSGSGGTVTQPSSPSVTTTTMTASAVDYQTYNVPAVTLTITITPGSGDVVSGGYVALRYNGQVIGYARVHLVNGVATASFLIGFNGTGDFTFTAQYLGSSQVQGSTSAPVTVTV